jgi:hypothetical protein
MNNQNNPLDFSQLKLVPHNISIKLKSEIHSIFEEISSERATKFESDINAFVQANPEYHWTLFFCRQCREKFLENAQPENDNDYDRMVYLFSFSDIEKINEYATIDNIDLNALDQIDFVFNTNLSIWVSNGYAPATFLDATFHKWDLENKLVKKDREAEVIYLKNLVLTMISRNFAELTRSRYNLDSMSYAKMIWTILENSISSCEKQDILRTYFTEDDDYLLIVDSIYFYFEHLLHFDMENEFNSEIDADFSQFQGYRTDFVALSETLLEMDLFDL